jgi:hypothetical protein
MSPFTSYSEARSLQGDLVVLLRSAAKSNPDMGDREHIGIAWGSPWQAIDRPTYRRVVQLNARLARHLNFEYLTRKELEDALLKAISEYRNSSPRPNIREYADAVLSEMAKPARSLVFYLGVNHLKVKKSLTIGDVEILTKAQAKRAIDNNRWPSAFNDSPSFARLTIEGTNPQAQLQRARFAVQEALGAARLVIQEELGRMGGIREQWLFDLSGDWVARYGARWSSGWWRKPEPMLLELPDDARWRDPIKSFDESLTLVPERFRACCRTAINWLDAATREGYWRISIPMVYSAMESILVPETTGLKAEVVTVRSIAMQVAIGNPFRDPNKTLLGYSVRSALVHGGVTFDFDEKEAEDLRIDRQWWAFGVLKDFLVFIRDNERERLIEAMRDLDRSDSMRQVTEWFEGHGAEKLIAEYRKAVA